MTDSAAQGSTIDKKKSSIQSHSTSSMPSNKEVNPRSRSRSGCLTCRRKKKRCDQARPKCGLCSRVGTYCEWPIAGYENSNKKRKFQTKFIACNDPLQTPNHTEVSKNDLYGNETFDSPFIFDDALINIPMITNDSSESSQILPNLNGVFFEELPLYKSPSLPLVLTLNSKELEYFEYYCNNIALNISIVPKKHNYFLKVFLPMSHNNEAVLYSLIAWGCIFKAHDENQTPSAGVALIETAKVYLQTQKDSFITSLATYIILMCIEITTGSTFGWSHYLTNGYDLINQMGGFKILKDYSEEGKVLAENFAYFDILASQSNENGTYYPVNEYNSIFKMTSNLVDPLLGCAKPLILILGDVINLVVGFRNLDSTSNEYYERLEVILKKASQLEHKLNKAKILKKDYQALKEIDDLSYHEKMFQLYCITIQLYISQAVRRLPPIVPEIQLEVKKGNIFMDALISSPLKLGLCFPLLILGINSITIEDRDLTKWRLELLKQKYQFKSVDKISHIIDEVWKTNNEGEICVDYFEVTKKFGWKLNIGR